MANTLVSMFRKNIRSYILILALLAIWIGFGLATPAYYSADHIQNILTQMAIIAIMACGMVFVIVTGGIDLSVGYGAGFVSVVAAALLYFNVITNPLAAMFPNMSPERLEVLTALIVVLLCLLLGVLIGIFQGSIIAYLGVPPFIATLGGMFIFKSGILLVTRGKSLFISSNDTYKYIAQGLLPPGVGYALVALVAAVLFTMVFTSRARKQKYAIALPPIGMDLAKAGFFTLIVLGYVLVVNRAFDPEADPSVRGVPFLVVLLALIGVLMSYISTNTRFGRYTYAIGGNREAARLSGINIKRCIFGIFVTMGALMGVSGIALAAYVGSGTTGAGGGYELDVIASCILGGTSTLGGEGTIFGAIIGALIMQSLSNGLQMMNVNSNVQYLIKGLVLILAVWADISMKKKKA
ncbi:MAG TPA: sugar ABC transporter permease [Candidatus Aminicenantes bacterium]|nr:sugar ABC transporter permease [Candidatus Aminicenantes bacterium]